jgi:NTE family protein
VLIRPGIEGFTSLNFLPAVVDALIRRGRSAAESTLTRASCLPRGSTPSRLRLPRRIQAVSIGTANPSERLALIRLLGLGLSDTLEPALLRSRIRNLAQSEAYQAVWLSPRGAGDSISFDVSLHRAARRVAGLGLAYDNELGGRMWVGAVDRRFAGFALEGSSALFLGEVRKEFYVGFRRSYQIGRQLMTPTLTANLASESVRRFDATGEEVEANDIKEIMAFLGVERYLGRDWQLSVGGAIHDWSEEGRDLSTVGGAIRAFKASRAGGRVDEGSFLWTGAYHRVSVEGEASSRIGHLRLRPRMRFGWGERLPVQSAFPLGGENGFPGLHIGERRGDREALIGLLMTYPLLGPVLARIDMAVGRSAQRGPVFDSAGWLIGARIGVGAETPLGPVRFEYGRNNDGRGSAFVRLGRWF